MSMTYRQLQEEIAHMTEEQKNCHISVYKNDIDEFFEVHGLGFSDERNDVLDKGHPVLELDA
jgi:hypothetical protein